MTRIIHLTRERLLARQAELYERLGMDRAGFEAYERTRVLDGEQWETLEELQGIWFLLGE